MTPFLNGTPEEINQSIRNLAKQGLFTILEDDPERGLRVEISPELRSLITATGCTDEEIKERIDAVLAFRRQGVISTTAALKLVFTSKEAQS